MAIIYNGAPLSSLKYNGENVSVVWVCDTSTTCCTKVFGPAEYCMPASIVCFYDDINSVYCYGASGSFGNNTICGKQLCLYACTEYFCAYLDTPYSSLCFASLCFDTHDFIGCTLETETCDVAALLRLTSRCPTGTGDCTGAIATASFMDDGNISNTIISRATTCVNLIAPNSYVYGCMCCENFGSYFQNFVKNVCYIDTCINDWWLSPEDGTWCYACIFVRIKDSAGNVILCGTYRPTYTQVVLC